MPRWPGRIHAQVPIRDKFYAKVLISSADPDACWDWSGATGTLGYPLMHRGGRKGGQSNACRISYEIHNGPIPSGMVTRHTCHNKRCTNPRHLIIGTIAQNNDDTARALRGGHKLTPDDVRVIKAHPHPYVAAREFGVAYSTVKRIRRGISWKYV